MGYRERQGEREREIEGERELKYRYIVRNEALKKGCKIY